MTPEEINYYNLNQKSRKMVDITIPEEQVVKMHNEILKGTAEDCLNHIAFCLDELRSNFKNEDGTRNEMVEYYALCNIGTIIDFYNQLKGEIDIPELTNKDLYDKVVSKCNQQEEENKELVTKCNQLEKEKMEQDDTIDELIEDRNELSSKVLQLEKKLEIATKAFEYVKEFIEHQNRSIRIRNEYDIDWNIVKDTLEQIQEVK